MRQEENFRGACPRIGDARDGRGRERLHLQRPREVRLQDRLLQVLPSYKLESVELQECACKAPASISRCGASMPWRTRAKFRASITAASGEK